MYSASCKRSNKRLAFLVSMACMSMLIMSCDFIKMKKDDRASGDSRKQVARVSNTFLYQDELIGIVPPGTIKQDSVSRVEAFVNSWIRKQLLIQEASKKIDINEAEVERKILDYRYSIIAYEYQAFYIRMN